MKQKQIMGYHAILPDGREIELHHGKCLNCPFTKECYSTMVFLACFDIVSELDDDDLTIKRLTGQRVRK